LIYYKKKIRKRMKRVGLLVLMILAGAATLSAQELEVSVTINTPTLQTTDPKVFRELENSIANFMNNQRWTNAEFEQNERIKVNITLTIDQEFSATRFGADMGIQAVRPVFGSNYETALITHLDSDVTFTYEQFQPILYSENTFNDNLSAILSFYAFIIIGLDFDSFSPFGGEPYFQVAQDIVNSIPSAAAQNNKGWRSIDGNRNRYWIIENLLSPRVRPYRQAMYDYHRQALDIMQQDAGSGRIIMEKALEDLRQVNQAYPNTMILQMFVNAKSSEVIEIFKQGTPQQKNTVIQVMSKLDAANSSKYRAIR